MIKSGRYPLRIDYADVRIEDGQPTISIVATLVHTNPPVHISIPATILLPPKDQDRDFIQAQVLEFVEIKYGRDTAHKFFSSYADKPLEYWLNLYDLETSMLNTERIMREADHVLI